MNRNNQAIYDSLAYSRLMDLPQTIRDERIAQSSYKETVAAMIRYVKALHAYAYQDIKNSPDFNIKKAPGMMAENAEKAFESESKKFIDVIYDKNHNALKSFAHNPLLLAQYMQDFLKKLNKSELRELKGELFFEEGEGLVIRTMLAKIASECGCVLDYRRVENNDLSLKGSIDDRILIKPLSKPKVLKRSVSLPHISSHAQKAEVIQIPDRWQSAQDKRLIADVAYKKALSTKENTVILTFSTIEGAEEFTFSKTFLEKIAPQVLLVRKGNALKQFNAEGQVIKTKQASQDYIAMMDGGGLPAYKFFKQLKQHDNIDINTLTFPVSDINYHLLGMKHEDIICGIEIGKNVPILNAATDMYLNLSFEERDKIFKPFLSKAKVDVRQIVENEQLLKEQAQNESLQLKILLDKALIRAKAMNSFIELKVNEKIQGIESLPRNIHPACVFTAGGGGAGKSMHEAVYKEGKKHWVVISRDEDRIIFMAPFLTHNAIGHEGDWKDIVTCGDRLQWQVLKKIPLRVHMYNDGSLAGGRWEDKYEAKFKEAKNNGMTTVLLATVAPIDNTEKPLGGAMERVKRRKEAIGRPLAPDLVVGMHSQWAKSFMKVVTDQYQHSPLVDHVYMVDNSAAEKGKDYLLAHTFTVNEEEWQQLQILKGKALQEYFAKNAKEDKPGIIASTHYKTYAEVNPEAVKKSKVDYMLLDTKEGVRRILAIHNVEAFVCFLKQAQVNPKARNNEELTQATQAFMVGKSIDIYQNTTTLPFHITKQLENMVQGAARSIQVKA